MGRDPRHVLDEAAQQRVAADVLPRKGGWTRGAVVRVEKGGVVLTVPGRRLDGGEDVRVWVAVGGHGYTFAASVIRTGVPVPDRSQDGLLLGFIDQWRESEEPPAARTVALLPPNGPPISLLDPPARLVELSVERMAFALPLDFTVIFVEGGRVSVRLAAPDRSPVEVAGRVTSLAEQDGTLLYGLAFEGASDAVAFRETVEALTQ